MKLVKYAKPKVLFKIQVFFFGRGVLGLINANVLHIL